MRPEERRSRRNVLYEIEPNPEVAVRRILKAIVLAWIGKKILQRVRGDDNSMRDVADRGRRKRRRMA
jgi:hypothetical protein